jgi:hypothetical protein
MVTSPLVRSGVFFRRRLPRHRHRATTPLLAFALTCVVVCTLLAAELGEAASQAYAEHANRSRQSFLDRFNHDLGISNADRTALGQGRITVRPGSGNGILNVPGGLIHHWFAAILIPGVTLDQVVNVSRAYRDYPSIFHPIMSAMLLSDDGDSLRVQFRMRESAAGMSATLDMTSRVVYARPDARHAYVISSADEIHEVKDAGRPTERRLPAGRDSGYLWRAGAFTKFTEEDGGVSMEMETIGLSRPFPPMMGWMIEPIARRIGRRSVEQSVEEFRQAVLKRYAQSR